MKYSSNYVGKHCPTSKTEPGQAYSISEIIRKTLRGEAINLNTNYYFEESILPTDKLDIDIVDVDSIRKNANANLKRERENVKNDSTQQVPSLDQPTTSAENNE